VRRVSTVNRRRISPAGLVAYVDRLAAPDGELDEQRLAEALEALLEDHRRRGSPAEGLIARGAAIFLTPAGHGRVEVRLGWLDGWPAERVRGHGMRLGFISTECGCRST
jgi:hypothetical protein